MREKLNALDRRGVGKDEMDSARNFSMPAMGAVLAGLLLVSCATGPRSRDTGAGTEAPSVRALRQESREILGEFVALPEGERQEQMIVFSYMLHAIQVSETTVPPEAWPALGEAVWPILLEILEMEERDSSWDIWARGPALKLLGPLEIEEAIPLLRRMVDAEDIYLARQAIDALGLLGDTESIPRLQEKLEAVTRPGKYGGGLDMTTPRYAALALWRLGDMQGAEILRQLLDYPAQNVRVGAATALAEMGESEGVRVLEAALQNPGTFRMDIIRALGKIDHPRAVELLEREMNVGDLRGRLLAARYLAEKGGSPGRKLLLETVRTGERAYAYLAAMHLAAIRDRAAVPILEEFYLLVDEEKRLAAAAALAAMGSEAGYRDVIKSLQYEWWSHRAVASAMLLIIPPPPEG